MPCASLSPPPSPSPVKGEGIEEVKSLPEITLDLVIGSEARSKALEASGDINLWTVSQ